MKQGQATELKSPETRKESTGENVEQFGVEFRNRQDGDGCGKNKYFPG